MRTPILVTLALVAALQGCTSPPLADSPLEQLLDAIEQRLDLAEAVALHKWDQRQPVQASGRERQVIASVRDAASAQGLQADRAEAFFTDQMEANKLLQYSALAHWNLHQKAPPTARQHLQLELRPQFDRRQAELLQRLARFDRQPTPRCANLLARSIEQRSLDPLRRLALVRATGQLCDKP